MKQYVITEKAGRFVAGQRNAGVGTVLSLTEKAAEAGLREGALIIKKDETEPPAPREPQVTRAAQAPQTAQPAPKVQTRKAD